MKEVMISIEEIYVPAKRQHDVDPEKVDEIAESILEKGFDQAIQVRHDAERNRYVLVAGLQRLEAMKALGEVEVPCLVVQPRQR